jgi:hypothetical protein
MLQKNKKLLVFYYIKMVKMMAMMTICFKTIKKNLILIDFDVAHLREYFYIRVIRKTSLEFFFFLFLE